MEAGDIVHVVHFQFSFSLLMHPPPASPATPIPANPFHQSIQPACLGGCCSLAIDTLIAVGHIEKIILLMVILIQLAHGSTGGRDGVIDEEEQSIFWPQVDPLSD